MLQAVAENTGRKNRQKIAIWAPSHNFVGLYFRLLWPNGTHLSYCWPISATAEILYTFMDNAQSYKQCTVCDNASCIVVVTLYVHSSFADCSTAARE